MTGTEGTRFVGTHTRSLESLDLYLARFWLLAPCKQTQLTLTAFRKKSKRKLLEAIKEAFSKFLGAKKTTKEMKETRGFKALSVAYPGKYLEFLRVKLRQMMSLSHEGRGRGIVFYALESSHSTRPPTFETT